MAQRRSVELHGPSLRRVRAFPARRRRIFVAAAAGGIWKSHEQRRHVAAAVRRQGHRLDGHARHRAERHEHRLGRHGRAELAQHDRAGRRRLQVDERRRHVDVHGAARRRSTSAASQIDPRNANVVYVAALGPAWKAGGDRGLYKTTDGGATWKLIKVGANAKTGAIDVADRSVESRRHLPLDVGALSHAVLAQQRRRRLGALQVDRRRRDVDRDQGQRISRGPEGTHRPRDRAEQSAGRLRADRSGVDRARAGHVPARLRRRTVSIARPTAARRGRT